MLDKKLQKEIISLKEKGGHLIANPLSLIVKM
mgnify:CR=1 FL=1